MIGLAGLDPLGNFVEVVAIDLRDLERAMGDPDPVFITSRESCTQGRALDLRIDNVDCADIEGFLVANVSRIFAFATPVGLLSLKI